MPLKSIISASFLGFVRLQNCVQICLSGNVTALQKHVDFQPGPDWMLPRKPWLVSATAKRENVCSWGKKGVRILSLALHWFLQSSLLTCLLSTAPILPNSVRLLIPRCSNLTPSLPIQKGKKPLMTAKLFGFIYIIFLFTYFHPCLKIRISLIKTFTTFLCEKLEYLSMIKTIVLPGASFWDRMSHAYLNDTCSLVCHNPHYSLLYPTVRLSIGFSFSTLLSLLFFFVVQRYFSLPMYL